MHRIPRAVVSAATPHVRRVFVAVPLDLPVVCRIVTAAFI